MKIIRIIMIVVFVFLKEMQKYEIMRRSRGEATYNKRNPDGDPFSFYEPQKIIKNKHIKPIVVSVIFFFITISPLILILLLKQNLHMWTLYDPARSSGRLTVQT